MVSLSGVAACGARAGLLDYTRAEAPDTPVPEDAAEASVTEADGTDDVVTEDDAPDAILLLPADASMDTPEELPEAPCDAAVPICVQLLALESSCFGLDVLALACQSGLIPDGSDDLMQIVVLCTTNLQRVQRACQ